MKKALILAIVALILSAGAVYSGGVMAANPGQPQEFFPGHWHDEHNKAVSAPAHSGGTDAFGCHNGSVPYHCH